MRAFASLVRGSLGATKREGVKAKSDDFKQLLLEDYEAPSDATWKSEQAGETRVSSSD